MLPAGYGLDGRHNNETRSQFELRQRAHAGLVGKLALAAPKALAKAERSTRSGPASASGSRGSTPGASASLYLSGLSMADFDGLNLKTPFVATRRPPRPITPDDFGEPWLSATDGGAGAAAARLLAGRPGIGIWPGDETFGATALEASGLGGAAEPPGAADIIPHALEQSDRHFPAADEQGGFKRGILRRLTETVTAVQKRTLRARSAQFYPELAVLVAEVVQASGMAEGGSQFESAADRVVPTLDQTFVKFKELAEVHYGAKSLWVEGNRFCALGGVQYSTASSCIGELEQPVDVQPAKGLGADGSGIGGVVEGLDGELLGRAVVQLLAGWRLDSGAIAEVEAEGLAWRWRLSTPPVAAAAPGVSWGERSLEASLSNLEGVYERLHAAAAKENVIDGDGDGGGGGGGGEQPASQALDKIVQLGLALQRCVIHMNEIAVADAARAASRRGKRPKPKAKAVAVANRSDDEDEALPAGAGAIGVEEVEEEEEEGEPQPPLRLAVRVGIAIGPAVVGFFGMTGEPFVYDVCGATLDEAVRLEGSDGNDSGILLDSKAAEVMGCVYTLEERRAVGKVVPGLPTDFAVVGVDTTAAEPPPRYRPLEDLPWHDDGEHDDEDDGRPTSSSSFRSRRPLDSTRASLSSAASSVSALGLAAPKPLRQAPELRLRFETWRVAAEQSVAASADAIFGRLRRRPSLQSAHRQPPGMVGAAPRGPRDRPSLRPGVRATSTLALPLNGPRGPPRRKKQQGAAARRRSEADTGSIQLGPVSASSRGSTASGSFRRDSLAADWGKLGERSHGEDSELQQLHAF